jgi:EAL domain-containing protein (putative c-di-GMP-specific phosphodiesterase class I)/FixJ family two-component response regulator
MSASIASPTLDALAGLSILVIDDHDFQRNAGMLLLRTYGAQRALGAASGLQALHILSAESLDLVICDLEMPDMDGMEVLRHLGMQRNTVPIIIHSAQHLAVADAAAAMAMAYGTNVLGVLPKPLRREQLAALLASASPITRSVAPNVVAPALEDIIAGVADNQFVPFFQPKFAIATGRIVGAEALARWRHPVHGLLEAGIFINPLEQAGQIGALTLSIVRAVVEACRGWNALGTEISASVNLSSILLDDPLFAKHLIRTLRSSGVKPTQLVFEITETAAFSNFAPALENLTRLRMRGFGLSIDDYGTGFSSMSQLLRIPFSELKIDQSFVRNCDSNAKSMAAVRSSIGMAQALSLKTVAEGIESRAELEALRDAGCDMAQGYYLARPMELGAFNSLLELHTAQAT